MKGFDLVSVRLRLRRVEFEIFVRSAKYALEGVQYDLKSVHFDVQIACVARFELWPK